MKIFKKDKPESPIEIIKNTIHINIEDGMYIEKFSDFKDVYYYYYYAKIYVPKDRFESVKMQLASSFYEKDDKNFIPNGDECSWWDMDNDKIIHWYEGLSVEHKKLFGSNHRPHDIDMFLCSEECGNYYLYVMY